MEPYYDSRAFVLFVCSEGADADPGLAILYASDQNIHQSLSLPLARNVTATNYGIRIDPPPLPGTIQYSFLNDLSLCMPYYQGQLQLCPALSFKDGLTTS